MKSLTIHIANTHATYRITDKKTLKKLQKFSANAKQQFNFDDFSEVTLSEFEKLDVTAQIGAIVSYVSFSQYFQFKGHAVVAFEHTPFGLFCEYKTVNKLFSELEVVEYYKEMVYSRDELMEYKLFQQSLEDVVSQ